MSNEWKKHKQAFLSAELKANYFLFLKKAPYKIEEKIITWK